MVMIGSKTTMVPRMKPRLETLVKTDVPFPTPYNGYDNSYTEICNP